MTENYKNILRYIGTQSSWMLLGKVFFVGASFMSSVIMARILGPFALGQYRLGLTIIQIVLIFSIAGLDRGLIRYVPIYINESAIKAKNLIRYNIKISIIISVTILVFMIMFSEGLSVYFFHSDGMTKVLIEFSFIIPILTVSRIVSGGTIGLKRSDIDSNITNVLAPALFLLSLCLINILKYNLFEIILARIIVSLLCVFIQMYFLNSRLPKVSDEKQYPINRSAYFSYSIPLMLIGFIYYLLGHIDILMLGYFLEERDVGIYSVAISLSAMVVIGFEVILTSFRPIIAELSQNESSQTLKKLYKVISKWMFYSGAFVFCLIILFRTEALAIFGREYVEGANVLIILCIGNLLNMSSGPAGQILVMSGKQNYEVLNSVVMIILNFAFNLYFIPRIGMEGAALGTALSIFLINLLKITEVSVIFRMNPYCFKMIKGAFAIFAGAFVCYYLKPIIVKSIITPTIGIIVTTIIFCIVIIFCMLVFGLDDEDMMLFKKQK